MRPAEANQNSCDEIHISGFCVYLSFFLCNYHCVSVFCVQLCGYTLQRCIIWRQPKLAVSRRLITVQSKYSTALTCPAVAICSESDIRWGEGMIKWRQSTTTPGNLDLMLFRILEHICSEDVKKIYNITITITFIFHYDIKWGEGLIKWRQSTTRCNSNLLPFRIL